MKTGIRKTKESFIGEAHKVHGDKYDYSKVEYHNSHTKVCIICPEHGEFWQTPNSHLRNQNCPNCGRRKVHQSNRLTTKEFINRARSVHGDKYDYSKSNYIDSHSNICIICPNHGDFWQIAGNHLHKQGCPICSIKTGDDFIEESTKIHDSKYDYSKVEYNNSQEKVCIICPEHGEFWQRPAAHRTGKGCSKCRSSKGERTIRRILSSRNIQTKEQYRFKDCKNLKTLPFDFYLPELNTCIEYDGRQHFEVSEFFGGQKGYDLRILNDSIKTDYCINKGIKLIRIRYDENIESILENNL